MTAKVLMVVGTSSSETAVDTDPFAASLSRPADEVESALDMAQLEAIIWGS